MNIIRCTKSSDLADLYKSDALTFEGVIIDDDAFEYLVHWLEANDCRMLNDDFYVIKGKLMNETYVLTGNNQYNDDLNILCIKLSDLSNVSGIAIPRFDIGGRWFTDVVDNNISREI